MNSTIQSPESTGFLNQRTEQLLDLHRQEIFKSTDRMFSVLLLVEWLASVGAAIWISPRAWSGATSYTHIHVWAALLLGGLISSLPIALAFYMPGRAITRHVIAIAQMLTSALLIHLTGGRLETHFHVFGSLAFLAFYRDWRVLVTATVVVAADHFLRGLLWPESVYGVLAAPWWRSMEHAGWVVFEDIILIRWCLLGNREMRQIAQRTAELETTNASIEKTVIQRTSQLRASEDFARNILNSARDVFVSMNSDGNTVEWNHAAESVFGWKREEVLGKKLSDLIIPLDFREPHAAGLQRFLSTGEGPVLNSRLELSAIRRDGTQFPAELTISPLKSESGWIFSAFLRDITARKQNEQELKAAKEHAESASRAKSEFLANMSHEIRTPLNGIVGMTELALDTQLNAAQREYLSTVKSCSDSLLTVINDILDFSKIEAGKLQMDRISFNLTDLIGDTCKTLGFRAHQKGLELACRIAHDIPDGLLGDPGRVRQVLVNLAGNAIKFTSRGEVVVQAEISSRTQHHVVVHFTVEDTGIGIPVDKQAAIFHAFEQADTSTTRTYGGTGLGLSIASKLIVLMNGQIWVESQPESGSKFHFTAKFDIDPAAVPREPVRSTQLPAGRSVLVVDDNQTNRNILGEVLTKWHLMPTLVSGGIDAIAVMEQAAKNGQPFSLVLLDAQMPEMDGFMLVERIKNNPLLRSATLMMLSSAAQHADAIRCRKMGVSAYLTKPVKQCELLEAVSQLLAPAGHSAVDGSNRPVSVAPVQSTRRFQILLAEDNPVNQRVAVGILEKRGHTVLAVDNGLQALKALDTQKFDLLLMDLQMPEMDGFAATAAIRKQEEASDKHLPIVAMTARAMKGDRECCMNAGMDGYVSKPVNPKELLATIESLIPTANDSQPPTSADDGQFKLMHEHLTSTNGMSAANHTNGEPAADQAIDLNALLDRVENDTALLDEMIELYLDSSPRLVEEIEKGILCHDPGTLQRAAHALKGALQNLSAEPSAEAAKKIEMMGRMEDLTDAVQSLADLKQELARLHSALESRSEMVKL